MCQGAKPVFARLAQRSGARAEGTPAVALSSKAALCTSCKEPHCLASRARPLSLKLQRGSTSVQPKIRQLSKTYVLLVLYSRTNPLDDWCGPQCALLLVWKSSAPLMFCLMFGISFAFQTSSSEKQSFISMFPTKKRVTIWLFITM